MKRFDALSDNAKGAVLLLMAAGGFALMSALIKWAGERLHVTQILFIRQLGMALIIAPTLAKDFPESLKTERLGLQCLRVVCALVAMLAGFTAMIHMPLADATAIGFAKSFFITILAAVVLKETVGLHRWGAVVVGFVGVLVMLKPDASGFDHYGLYALLGAAAAGATMAIIRLLTRTESTTSILSYQVFGVGALMFIPACLYWQWPTWQEWGILAAIGGVSYVAQKLNINAYRHGEASVLASLDYVRLVYAACFGFLLFGNLPELTTWIGAGIIILASLYTVHRESKRRQNLARSPQGRGFNNV